MLNLYIYSTSTIFLYYLFGQTFIKKVEPNFIQFTKCIIYGSSLISFLALTLNFFTPLTKEINSLLFLIILILFFKSNFLHIKKNIFFLILTTFLVYLLLFASHTYRPDAGLYHLPFINILNEEKIIFGLTNLHFRFGHTSIIQYLSAINFNFITGINGISIPTAVIASAVIINFLTRIKDHIFNKNYNFHFYFLIGIIIYIFFKMNRYAEYGNDAPAHFLTFYFFSEILSIDKKKININELLNVCLIGIFIVFNKITLALILIIPLVLIIKNKFFIIFKKFNFYFIIFFSIVWVVKNIIISGCLIYPIKATCNQNLNWSDIDTVDKISLENEAWAKNWSNYEGKNKISQSEYIKKFNWLRTWSEKLFNEQKEKSFAYILIWTIIFFFLLKKSKKNKEYIHKEFLFLLVLAASTIVWFIKIPEFRYSYSIIISLITYPFAWILSNRYYDKNPKKIFSSIIIIFSLIFLFKNFIRIFNTNIYYDYPYPRIYSHKDDNKKLKYNYKLINGKRIYNQKNGYCMYNHNLCTPYKTNIYIENKKGYLFFFKKT